MGIGQEVIERCRQLAKHTEEPGWITRTFLSEPMHCVHADLRTWMEQAGMSVQVDAAGNLRGYYGGMTADAPRLIVGSHLDTVPHAGAFDGILGVVLGVALVKALGGTRVWDLASKSWDFPKKRACASACPSSEAARLWALSTMRCWQGAMPRRIRR